MILDRLARPVVLAPMAGGPSTPELALAVDRAGGLGFLAGAYLTPAALREAIARVRAGGIGPFGVNLFVPGPRTVPRAELGAYAARLRPEAERYGTELGPPRDHDDDGWDAKLDLLVAERVPVASFTFGCPPPPVIRRLHAAGSEVWVTVNRTDEAEAAAAAGADVVVAQGIEAGGHQGGWLGGAAAPEGTGLLALIGLVRERAGLPVVAAGGIADGAAVAAVLAAGARAAQVGTAFLCSPEAGTHPVYREALLAGGPTALTRAFTGRWARGLRNRFIDEHGPHAPGAFPAVHHITAPLRAAARAAGDPGAMSLWAGQAVDRIAPRPAAEIVADLADGARAVLAGLARDAGG